jgi:hypothetical protein
MVSLMFYVRRLDGVCDNAEPTVILECVKNELSLSESVYGNYPSP